MWWQFSAGSCGIVDLESERIVADSVEIPGFPEIVGVSVEFRGFPIIADSLSFREFPRRENEFLATFPSGKLDGRVW